MVAIVRLGTLLGLIFLSSCSQYLNMSRLEADIQDDIERQGRRLSLKQVICPNRAIKQADVNYRCDGELPDGGQFTINVIQQDDQGNVSWDVPSSKVLINLASLEEDIQEEMRSAVGKSLAIDCGDTYRQNQRGDSFECDVVGAGAVAAGRVESVLVKVNNESNLEWQEVLIGAVPAVPGAAEPPAPQATPPNEETSETATTDSSTAADQTPDSAVENEGDEEALAPDL